MVKIEKSTDIYAGSPNSVLVPLTRFPAQVLINSMQI